MIDTDSTACPVAAGLFTDEIRPRLIAGRHRETRHVVFPCPQGDEGKMYEPAPLGREGTLWSWTVQRFRPKTPPYRGPAAFEPYAVGYVELPGEIIVETRLTEARFDALRIGMPLEMTLLTLIHDGDSAVVTYAFRPIREDRA